MTNQEKLAVDLILAGKQTTWEEYGKLYHISADSARKVGAKIRNNPAYVKEVLSKNEAQEKFPKINIKEYGIRQITKADLDWAKRGNEILNNGYREYEKKQHQNISDVTEKDIYIAELEAQVIAYEEDNKQGTAIKTVQYNEEIKTLSDLINVCNIDTSIWTIDKYVQNYWGGKYQVKAFLSKIKVDQNLEAQKNILLDEIRKYQNGEYKVIESECDLECAIDIAASPTKEGHFDIDGKFVEFKNKLLELDIFDLHLGKLSWKGETGEDYDMEIASNRYIECVRELIGRVKMETIDKILLPIGNDMIHIDNKFKTTTNGTPQDTDSRFTKIIKVARALLVRVIDELSLYAKVDVIVVPGNHDQTVMFSLGEILDAFYTSNRRVNIYNSPKLRKYYQYGQSMIMFTHGSEEKHADLGLIAATEEPLMWANTKYREVHLGHLHKSKSVKYTNVDEYQGFKIRIINSLSGTDAWHYSKGYMSLKGAEAFVWDKEKGLVSNHFYNL